MDTSRDPRRPSPHPVLNARGRNRLLAMLPADERERLLSSMVRRSFGPRELVLEAGQPIHHVYFPLHGAASLIVCMRDGEMTAVGTVGNEGMLGLPLLLGAEHSHAAGIFHTPGEAMVMSAADFRMETSPGGALVQTMQRYAQGLLSDMCQLAACNRLHPVEQRFCRWMLATHDRVGHGAVPVTQEFVATMLGVRRATVNLVVRALENEGVIEHQRGVVTVLDREGLEARSCECYAIIRMQYESALCVLPASAYYPSCEDAGTAGSVNTIVVPPRAGLSAQMRPR
jgi:CRP-like cAMP-binding protein